MAKGRWRNGLVGTSGAVDDIDGADLVDGDLTFGLDSGIIYPYWLDDDYNEAESSPDIIVPDSNPDTKNHRLAAIRVAQLLLSNPNTETLGATKTLVLTDPQLQFLDPGGSDRVVVLPAEASCAGLFFIVANTADADEDLTVKEDSETTTIAIVHESEAGLFFCDGTNWYGYRLLEGFTGA